MNNVATVEQQQLHIEVECGLSKTRIQYEYSGNTAVADRIRVNEYSAGYNVNCRYQ